MTNQKPGLHTDPARALVRHLDEVTGALEGLSQALEQHEELPLVLHRCCAQVTHALPGADYAGVSLLRDGRPYTAAATDELVHDLDAAQYNSGRGPCLRAAYTGHLVRATVADTTETWPEFARAAISAGIRSVFAAPLFLDREYHGTLNVYSHAAHGFGDLQAALLELYTTAVEAALRADLRYRKARGEAENLHQALANLAIVDQARGILMATHHVDADTAFTALIEQSQREKRELLDLARQLIADITTPTGA